jgi:hypothetical protein
MHIARGITLTLVVMSALCAPLSATAADDAVPVCVTARFGSGLGAARIDLKLFVDPQGSVSELAGEARFSQPVAPPGSLIVYAVSGAAISNADGVWGSLGGTGYDLAKTIYRVTIAAQLSSDPTKNTLSYTRQNLDGLGAITSTGAPEVTACPQP